MTSISLSFAPYRCTPHVWSSAIRDVSGYHLQLVSISVFAMLAGLTFGHIRLQSPAVYSCTIVRLGGSVECCTHWDTD